MNENHNTNENKCCFSFFSILNFAQATFEKKKQKKNRKKLENKNNTKQLIF